MTEFPALNLNLSDVTHISLRDYFAATATEDDIDNYQCKSVRSATNHMGTTKVHIEKKFVCTREEARYKYADAMLLARENKP